jgi:BON domain
MNSHRILWAHGIALSLAVGLVGCKTHPPTDDASLNSQVQSRLASDQNLSGQPIQASVASGVVTLNGSVNSDGARSIASGDAAQVAGIKTVVNNLIVQAPAPSVAALAPPPAAPVSSQPVPIRPDKVKKPSASIAHYAPEQSAPIVRNAPAPEPASQQNPPPPAEMRPPPPPAPVVHNITVPVGTSIPVRITQTLDSATTQPGDKFTGAVASDIYLDGMLVLAQGTPVTGHVDAVQDAAHFKGSSLLTISLTSISRRGERFDVATDAYTRQGEGRGKNTAEKVGGGAAVGAILGGIFGGGKGAAIGAAAGGGVGAGAQGVTRGQQVQITSETVVRFRLSNAIVVRVTTEPGSNEESGPALERHNNQ